MNSDSTPPTTKNQVGPEIKYGHGPLYGVKVLDITRFWNGPSATRNLSDYGATVIKVEMPNEGDPIRTQLPNNLPSGATAQSTTNWMFEAANRGKKSICIDLRHPNTKPVMKRLTEWADIVVDNFRSPNIMKGWGYGYVELKKWNPQIIYGQNSSFGPYGPKSGEGSFDAVAQAYAGAAVSNGGGTRYTPLHAPWAMADEVGAMNFTMGLLMAIIHKQKTGEGQKILTSQVGAMTQFQASDLVRYTMRGEQKNEGLDYRQKHYAQIMCICKDDKWIMLQVVLQKQWEGLCKGINRLDLIEDKRTVEVMARRENKIWMKKELDQAFKMKTRAEWLTIMKKMQVPAGPCNSYEDLVQEEQIWANNYLTRVKHDEKKEEFITIGKPLTFSKSPASKTGVAPELGEHTVEVLKDLLGFTEKEIAILGTDGAIGLGYNSSHINMFRARLAEAKRKKVASKM